MKRLIYSCVAVMSLCGCAMETELEKPGTPVVVRFEKRFVTGDTKSSVVPGDVETRDSGATVAFYDAATGLLDSQYMVEDLSLPLSLNLPEKRMNVYVLGNLWLLDGNGGKRVLTFPKEEKDVASITYELGVVPAGGGLHTEGYSDFGQFGIPVRGLSKNVEITSGAEVRVPVERMFAKVRITVDHSGISSVEGQFRNKKLYFRQANRAQKPFLEGGSKACSESDLMELSDYEYPMQDGSACSYTFYVPENRQTSPDPELATYVEFSAEVDKSAGGFGGGVTYRFYLGKESGVDNDVEGNTWYDVLLTFKLGSLFEPTWRVNPDSDFSDDRLFCVMKDRGCRSILGDQVIAVRSGRISSVYVYMNKTGITGSNQLVGKQMSDSFEASNLSDYGWSADFSGLAAYGISPSWDASSARLSLSVTDKSKFVSGVMVPVTLRLSPSSKNVVMNVLTAEEPSLDIGTSDFYLGMKQTMTVKGFTGKKLTVCIQRKSDGEKLKLSNDPSAPYIGFTRMDLPGNTFDLYAWGYSELFPVTLVFKSDDDFNDNEFEVSVDILKPEFQREVKQLALPIDGTEVPVNYVFKDKNGAVLDKRMFDDGLYEQLLEPDPSWSSDYADTYISYENGAFFIDYLGHASGSDGIIDNARYLGAVVMRPKSDQFLYQDSNLYELTVNIPGYKSNFPETLHTGYLNEYFDSEIDLYAEFMSYGNKVEISGKSSSGKALDCLRTVTVSDELTRFELHQGEMVDLTSVPGGENTICATIVNPRVKSGDKSMSWSSTVNIYHDMTVAPFGVFHENSPVLDVFLTYPKAAWMLKKYYSGEIQAMPDWFTAGEMNTYDKYLSWTRKQTTARNVQENLSSTGDRVTVMYCDLFPSEYPVQSDFTPLTASVAAGRTWLTDVSFRINGSNLAQPLPTGFLGGNKYYSIVSSTTPIGWVYSYK